MRVVVPDLERIARSYLKCLEASASGASGAEADYEWIMLELYDQMVRTRSGGAMLTYLQNRPVTNIAFIRERCGSEIAELSAPRTESSNRQNPWQILKQTIIRRLREVIVTKILGEERDMVNFLRFLQGGELHRWMYDRVSLKKLLITIGFEDVRIVSATESRIPMWATFELDSNLHGEPHKPDSLYAEAVKP